MDRPRFAAGASTLPDPVAAAAAAAEQARAGLDGAAADLVVVFVSPALCTDPWAIRDAVHETLGTARLIGCTSEAPIGDGHEFEDTAAIAVWAARLPGVTVRTFHLADDPDLPPGSAVLPDDLADLPADTPLVLLADPFSLHVDALLARHRSGGPTALVGGMASGGRRPGEHALFVDGDVHFEGAVGAALAGADAVPVVSQGAEPIGPEMVITAGGGQMVDELAGTPAFEKISAVVAELEDDQRSLIRQPLLAGIVIDENQPDYGRGDYLVRGIHGHDPATGAVFVAENVRVGQTMRLHVRDARSATDDLRLTVEEAVPAGAAVAGALMFTCNGRGRAMFDDADHDVTVVRRMYDVPIAGMFCNGEIGPVGGAPHVHGFSVAALLFLTPVP